MKSLTNWWAPTIDTGFDSLDEIIGGYPLSKALIFTVFNNVKDKREFLSKTLNSFIKSEVPTLYVSFDDAPKLLSHESLYHYVPEDCIALHKKARDLNRHNNLKAILIDDLTRLHPNLMLPESSTKCPLALVTEVKLRLLSADLYIPLIITIPRATLSLTFYDGFCEHNTIKQDADVMISLERRNNELQAVVTKNRYGPVSAEAN